MLQNEVSNLLILVIIVICKMKILILSTIVSVIIAEPTKVKRGIFGQHNHEIEKDDLSFNQNFVPSSQYGPPGGFGHSGGPSGSGFQVPENKGGGGFKLTGQPNEPALNGPQVGPDFPLGKVVNLGREIRNHVNIVNKVGVHIGRPIGIHVERKVPIKVPYPVDVPVPVNVPVHVPVKVHVKVFKDIPVQVVRKVPIPIEVGHVKVPLHVPVKIYHEKPVPVLIVKKVPVPVPHPIIVKKIQVPVVVKTIFKPLSHRWSDGWQ